MLDKLKTIVENTNQRVLGQVLKSRLNQDLYNWILLETSVLGPATLKERVFFLLNDKPDLLCKNGNKKKFVPGIGYGFCGSIKTCQCFKDQISEQAKKLDVKNIIEKRKITWLNKYGVENVSQNVDIKQKRLTTLSTRNYDKIRQKLKDEKETIGFEQVISRLSGIVEPCFTRSDYRGSFRKNFYKWKCVKCQSEFTDHVDYGRVPRCLTCFPANVSIAELELREWINSLSIELIENDRSILSNLELDILIPSKLVAIEFNGCYWHSEKFKDPKYHINKYLQCKEKGIHLIQIFEDEWVSKKEIVKSRLMSVFRMGQKLQARKCQIRKITPSEYRKFTNETHLQGYASASIMYGLTFEEKIVAVMSFSRTRYSKEGFELIRYCSTGNVIGGASKLFSAFLKEYQPNVVISYANRCWSNGNLYRKLGFTDITKDQTNIGFWYVKGYKRYHRSTFTKKRLVNLGFDSSKTADMITEEEGFLKVYDCGNYKWKWTKGQELRS